MKAPWFPFYTGDFLASSDVQLMEAHEVGGYVLLLAHSWQFDQPGYLPNDEGRLRRWARMSAAQWADSKDLILAKWPVAEDPALRYNPRLLKEAGKQVELREKKAEAGRLSAERRARLAAQGQQNANTNPTPVEVPATGVGQNANYSQPQSQPQSQEGKPSASTASLRSADAPQEGQLPVVSETPQGVKSLPEDSNASASHTKGGAAKKHTRHIPPTEDELLAYMLEQRPFNAPADVERVATKCFAYYTSNGWKVGRAPMKDWHGCAQTFLSDLPKLKQPAEGPVLTVHRNTYNAPAQVGGTQLSRRQQAIAGADARFDALAAGQNPLY